MPRRNRNASTPATPEALPDAIRAALLCLACRINPATTGDYCALCKGRITVSARRTILKRR
jgi:hypothetical protein